MMKSVNHQNLRQVDWKKIREKTVELDKILDIQIKYLSGD